MYAGQNPMQHVVLIVFQPRVILTFFGAIYFYIFGIRFIGGSGIKLIILNFCLFLCKQTNNKLPFAWWANSKKIKKNCLGFRFLLETTAYIFRYRQRNRKHRLPFIVCWPRKTNSRFPFVENKWKFLFSVSSVFQIYTVYWNKNIYIEIYK